MDIGLSSSATSIDRGNSAGTFSYLNDPYSSYADSSVYQATPGGSSSRNHPNEIDRLTTLKGPLELHNEEGDDEIDWFEDESEGEDDSRFVNFSLLSHIAVRLRDRVPRGTHVKGSIPYPRAFTGKDIVVSPRSALDIVLYI